MKFTKKYLLAFALLVFAFGAIVFVNFGYANNLACSMGIETAAKCGKCGDGFCNPRCGENSMTCPKDCSPSPDR